MLFPQWEFRINTNFKLIFLLRVFFLSISFYLCCFLFRCSTVQCFIFVAPRLPGLMWIFCAFSETLLAFFLSLSRTNRFFFLVWNKEQTYFSCCPTTTIWANTISSLLTEITIQIKAVIFVCSSSQEMLCTDRFWVVSVFSLFAWLHEGSDNIEYGQVEGRGRQRWAK